MINFIITLPQIIILLGFILVIPHVHTFDDTPIAKGVFEIGLIFSWILILGGSVSTSPIDNSLLWKSLKVFGFLLVFIGFAGCYWDEWKRDLYKTHITPGCLKEEKYSLLRRKNRDKNKS